MALKGFGNSKVIIELLIYNQSHIFGISVHINRVSARSVQQLFQTGEGEAK